MSFRSVKGVAVHTDIRLTSMEDTGKVLGAIAEQGFPCKVRIGPESRSLSQNALYWQWVGQMATYFTGKGYPLSKDDAHDLMRHQFLGYAGKTLGNTEIKPQLRSTTSLDRAEMAEYMTMVDQWAADKGCLLVKPGDSDYMQYMREQGGAA